MTVSLHCSEKIRNIVEELLHNRHIHIREESDVWLIERGLTLEKGKIGIVFDMESLHVLIDYLDAIVDKKEIVKDRITGKNSKGELKLLAYDDIYYFEAVNNDVTCKMKDTTYAIKEKLYQLEERLDNTSFIRVNKSYIVNIVKIDRIIPWFNSKLLLTFEGLDEEVDVTRTYLQQFKEMLDF
ncbi:LytTR family transcriptional regulator [Vallitalea pronyensis]|uniref:LytTR family transcriptional regulator n=2 Tax=Vallitalea pronyensis TaxID=1348613 RepID=A0A8J8MQ34_9FIRM|nr:LytTR family transcriptional regulator [Vallitalea pronyensis]